MPSMLEDSLARIVERDIKLNAWCAVTSKTSSNAAPALEFQNSYLRDFSVGIKDIIDVAGLPTRCGSAVFDNAPNALIDAACVALMRNAGSVIVGKTVTTELATFVPSSTRNPHNLEHTPGGSSAGSAAAVADGHVRIAIGTQTAGSVIRPAAYCGVFGFKPSFDVVPRIGVKVQSESLDTVGVFARSLQDCAAWLSAMLNAEVNTNSNRGPLKIAVITNLLEHASADMRDALGQASDALNAAGHHVSQLSLPAPLDEMHEHQRVIQNYESARAYTAERTTHAAQLDATLAQSLNENAKIPRAQYIESMRATETARRFADGLFRQHDVWLMPSAMSAAPRGLTSTGDPLFNRLASVLHTPAINTPSFKDGEGMPLGLQLIGARYEDEKLLHVAATVAETISAILSPKS
jgi:Asp-tRNA(Asn)/Glu-tRNA(Gln) amidotransferase A subunit family amidase